ncbi:MAG: SpoIIIAH-like family protein [Acutalibacteraceae bacterium]|nr:SpoIIIAH-like family protein [Acutalibacteraceae bacterium]
MKKGNVISKGQIGLAVMVLILAGAVWLNTKYSKEQSNTKYMGETTLVGSQQDSEDAAMVGAQAQQEDYFAKAKADREESYRQAEELITEALNGTDGEAKNTAANSSAQLAKRKTDETALENLLTAKGFENALAVIGENSVTVIIKSDGLVTEQTVQIQDAVMSILSVSLNNIKIVTVNS